MPFDNNYQVSSNFSELTHDFLSNHLIPPTPANYAVIYLYISNENELLTAAIDQKIKQNTPIMADFLADLFKRFVSFSEQIDSTVISPFEEVLSSTLEQISLQVGNEDKVTTSLHKLKIILSENKHHKSLKNIVSYLSDTINNTKEQHHELSKKLSTTQQEINQLKQKLESSRQEALIDSLTGLLNRRGCDDKLQALDFTQTHSSLVIDIDHFKKINDNFGHFIGDKVIQRIAKIIKNNLTEEDLAVRFGGEEFLVVMTNKSIIEAEDVAEKIRISIEKVKLIHRETNEPLPPISVSIGIAQNNNASDWSSLFKEADNALYQAKKSGRNRCICA
ncbi:diguanylate cyclase [Colwellia sp. 4_MG-2023]|jgi:diguanylate cyclase|uniref:GGDEF domain-containing protein n=1 Tax=unclassified Colwellia TaxID=196834 RepID=UPI0026E37EF0|nr:MULTISPECIES: GGDEF domain-containing protein [unclassified Colwellia]MDO6505752.1 diguanylate cyclase [Colwellia sp. 5_MG-2023]MDO6554433.1 diguanylate cyclase [Colwellia sp. 4_MG-2023]